MRHIAGALHRFSEDFRASIGGSATLRRDEREGKATAFLSRKAILGGWPAKRVYVDSVMDLIRNLDVTIFAMVMERPDRPIYHFSVLQPQHRWILERVDALIERKETGRMATLVFDGRSPSENIRLDKCFSNFFFRTAEGRAMTRIVPGVLFVDSEITPGIKLADFCAYILRVYYEQGLDRQEPHGDPYLATIKRYADIIRQKTFDWDEDGVRFWGIRTMGKDHFRYEE